LIAIQSLVIITVRSDKAHQVLSTSLRNSVSRIFFSAQHVFPFPFVHWLFIDDLFTIDSSIAHNRRSSFGKTVQQFCNSSCLFTRVTERDLFIRSLIHTGFSSRGLRLIRSHRSAIKTLCRVYLGLNYRRE